ncbi:MAG TPA: hypothetical protein VE524_07555 [Nitrososphaeraceae archaeon]|jgi:hypothetical protein|nr:hypothetical protein [Nitrososphaeraceae archaeon]
MSNEDSKSYKDNENEPATETSTTEETIVISPSNTAYKIHDQNSSVEQEDEEQGESISAKARETGQSFKDFIVTLGKKAMVITDEKTMETTNESIDIGAKRDSQSIQTLGANVEKAITVFEDTITDIRKEPYDEQANILTGYKKIIEEQINVINARLSMVKKFKQED